MKQTPNVTSECTNIAAQCLHFCTLLYLLRRQKAVAVCCVLWLMITGTANAQVKPAPVKNVILMISDGTSIGVVSAARWYNVYNGMGTSLNIDPYMCGTVKTFCSNAPIGDSAPTMSCYMTGIPQRTQSISTYSPASPQHDLLYPLDPERAYQPQITLLEAARILQQKATGLVVTCEFPHATPAACAAHYPERSKYEYLASQMAYNRLNVLFGGGSRLITDDIKARLQETQTPLIQKDIETFRKEHAAGNLWALLSENTIPYDLDRDEKQYPSLEEMTRKAIGMLSSHENGFFLMVEGSLVDYAAHANDVAGCITEFLAFDKAVGAAMEFAKKDGNTAVIVLSDHGNSGFTIGKKGCDDYSRLTLEDLFGNISEIKKTCSGLSDLLKNTPAGEIKKVFKQYTGIEVTEDEYQLLLTTLGKREGDYMKVNNSNNSVKTIVKLINDRNCFGFTTGGHTGEDVFLAAYHPHKDVPSGVRSNVEFHQYLCDIMGLTVPMVNLTDSIFAKHTAVFSGLNYEIQEGTSVPVLVVKNGKNTLEIPAFKSVAYLNKKAIDLTSVTVYVSKNKTFYLPKQLAELLTTKKKVK